MHTQSAVNNIYFLKEGLTQQELSSALTRCLCQAEALAIIATIIDIEAVGLDTFNNYLWTLSNVVQEAKSLHAYLL